jgi:AcrR family transcriptional regulator
MAPQKNQTGDTQSRLLESACKVFARKGFHDATIAEICDLAGASIAAVNYYFGSKEAIYVEAWRAAFRRSMDASPQDGGVPPDAPVEERLRGRILSMLRRVLDPENHEFEIVHKELANPTGLLAEVMRESIEPIRLAFDALVRELLGEKALQEQVMLCQMSIRSQCFD